MSDDEKNMDLSSNQTPQSKPSGRQSWKHLTAEYLNDLPRQLDELKTAFTAIYSMKDVFATAAKQCMGD